MGNKCLYDIKLFDINGQLVSYDPIASPNYVIGICHEGRFEANYDFQHVVFNPNELAVVYPNHILVPTNVTTDYRATIIVVPAAVFYSMLSYFIDRDYFRHETEPCFSLTAEEYDHMMRLTDALRVIDVIDCSTRREMKESMTEIIIKTIHHYHAIHHPQTTITSVGMLSKRFFQAIIEYCSAHHDVSFYADYFHLTPKYFSTVIANETGHNALYWIHFYLAAKAKQILYMQRDVPLKNISDQLGFADFVTFSRFFKRLVGISPSEWRKRICSTTPHQDCVDG